MVSFTHEQNSICSQKQLNGIAHEHTIIFRQLFAGLVVGSWPMKRKKHLHRMINNNYSAKWRWLVGYLPSREAARKISTTSHLLFGE